MMKNKKNQKISFPSEAELCAAFQTTIPDSWQVYNETAGYDMLLVHKESGHQIGVQAKLAMNAKVVSQALSSLGVYRKQAPDFVAVLVPSANDDFTNICHAIGITVLTMESVTGRERSYRSDRNFIAGAAYASYPGLPKFKSDIAYSYDSACWFDIAPANRHQLPEYIPDVVAGIKSPIQLSDWKIKALKACVLLDRQGYITRSEFLGLRMSVTVWTANKWIIPNGERGAFKIGPAFPGESWKLTHHSAYEQIVADFDAWAQKISTTLIAEREKQKAKRTRKKKAELQFL